MILASFLLWEVSKRVPANQIHGLRGLKNWKRDSAGIRTQGPQLRSQHYFLNNFLINRCL